MNLLERILHRFGFTREAPISELVVFADAAAARAAGFRGPSHPRHRYLRAWWPGAGMQGLMVRPPQRVTISRDMPEGDLRAILRKRQVAWGDQAMWVEL